MLHEYLLLSLWPMAILAIIGWMALGFLALRCLIVWANICFSPKLKISWSNSHKSPLISVLIPARNEAANIGATLQYLQKQSYKELEILILDDHSTDFTAAVVTSFAQEDPRIRLLQGEELPKGWLGKNWACQQLAQQAKGHYFLFIDADVQIAEGFIPTLIATSKRYRLQLLSVFPDQQLGSWGEKIVVPMMHYLLLSLLPLVWVRLLPYPSMAAANGQVMFFDAETYRQKHFHEKVKKEVVEDIAIAQLVKKTGQKAGVFLGNGLVSCRMYSSYASAVDGFSKNLLAGFGHSILGLMLFLSLITWCYIGLFALPSAYCYMALLLLVITNLGLAKLSNQNWLLLMLTHIPRTVALIHIAFQSISRKVKKTNEWKGRNVHID